jgi:hypothetical protein
MNILKMKDDLWNLPGLHYVGRTKHVLGLGNPWSHKANRQARYLVNTNREALYRYREWLMKKLIPNWISGLGVIGLDNWEAEYLKRVVLLSEQIQNGTYTSLGCWCINVENYVLVADGLEKCHAEILYKACLTLIAHKQGALL